MRTTFSLLLGLLLCVGIWWAVPYNNFALNNSFISDSYLPEVVVLCLSVLVLLINPMLRRWAPGAQLEQRHLTIICAMLLFAAILPSNGLFRFFPHSLAANTQKINLSPQLAPGIAESDLPAALFPDPIGRDIDTPVAGQLMDELESGESNPWSAIPWSAWIKPWLAWGTLIVAFWVLMIGMGLTVFPQWMNVERLAFPLLRIYHAMLSDPEPGKVMPPVFRSRLFWVGCGSIFAIHSLNGLAIFTEGGFPSFPVSWDISHALTDGFWAHMPGFLKRTRLYFIFIGLAFFMPGRFSFSIWFTVLVAGLGVSYARVYAPTFNTGSYYEMGSGAIIAMAIGIVWLGRAHYKQVFLAMIGKHVPDLEGTNGRLGGWLFLLGAAVMFGWFCWAGTGPLWATWFVFAAVVIMLIVTRIVAETGLVYVWIIPFTAQRLMGLCPSSWKNVSAAFMEGAHYILVNRSSAVSAAAITVLSLGLNPKSTATSRRNLAGLGLVVLVIGFLVCGAAHLYMGYTLPTSLDGTQTPVVGRGATQMSMGPVSSLVSGRVTHFDGDLATNITTGAVIAGVLLVLCGRFPGWPLHPIGMLFVHSSIGLRLFMSLFIGWLLKRMLVQIAGARAYRVAMPLFLGFIVGEVMANAIWTLIPVIQILMGIDPSSVHRMVIFQYT